MTLQPGFYDASRPRFTGVIRSDGEPAYACTHDHGSDVAAARRCAREALPLIRALGAVVPAADLPKGWVLARPAGRPAPL